MLLWLEDRCSASRAGHASAAVVQIDLRARIHAVAAACHDSHTVADETA